MPSSLFESTRPTPESPSTPTPGSSPNSTPPAIVVPSPNDVYLHQGFKPGWIYELVYTAKDPRVMGLGFTGVRDLISFLINADTDSD